MAAVEAEAEEAAAAAGRGGRRLDGAGLAAAAGRRVRHTRANAHELAIKSAQCTRTCRCRAG